ncbi:N-acetylmuramoyl-L-alanine amidase [Stutzerimonas balearica]|uniref:N-acetylmuramoyl-L-alanine amidase n=1 Tax=Stutzerimonas balearica TaxID=74829 RepID=UPI0007741DC9|nr:N-acetylmuramoyl-L-alanine amidase [Stutzerimonas balearica]MBB61700.1 N-acetylmuramoyl-L-alanine amidase [Pseudomonas sp.]MBZ5754608.1 N-acetylmuramoyl-L-alanine amidase [Pseudomonas sp. S5(2021)]WIX03113.1 N-acetylmuramoyl-L-alanine amidase [Pseudomonas sp. AR5]MBK3746573.1 N-acetylmuramoyl-L-alanine amidase [Stutzerimonas balearica]MBK3824770.1 N-acetylmuramoyl-L-alanine amidase [Stutzerimonas balearica]|tara:strand:- start:13 stop:792 length:780 start_codon:yes stop_codon:yes gene_type:complete
MKAFGLVALLLLLAGCASGPEIDTRYSAVAQDSRAQFIVLHYTSTDFEHSLELLSRGEVSSHYLIDRAPAKIYRLVDENRRAWHAGESEWQGRTWLNSSSIGIELVNPGYEQTADGRRLWYPYPEPQIDALILLLKDIMQRHGLKPGAIIGHSDIAAQRKVDPGPLFPWKRLADAGLLPWPDARLVAAHREVFSRALPATEWFQTQLAQQGYRVPRHGMLDEETRNVVAAFQMKYRPARFDGMPDAETAAILAALEAQR